MPNFAGGSAYAMARDIGDGFQIVTERTFKGFSRGEIEQLSFEIDRTLRELRAESQAGESPQEIQARQRKIQRLNTAQVILRTCRQRMVR